MTKKLYILLFILFSSYLYADKIPKNKIHIDKLNSIFSTIDAEYLASQLFEEVNGEFVEIDRNRKESFVFLGENPYDFQDDMGDVVSTFTAEETTNIDKARVSLNAVKAGAKFVQKFDGSSLVDLPIGMKQTFEETDVFIAINAVRIYPTYTAIEVFVELKRKDWKSPLIFYAPDIKFSQQGGLSGPSKVGLLGDMVIPVEENKSVLKFKRAVYDPELKEFTAGTFLQFGCDGFEAFGVDADLILSREWVVPIIPDQNIINPQGRVLGNFTTIMTDLQDMVFELSLRDFVIPQCDRLAWNVDQAVFDFSETKSLFSFPLPNLPYNPIEDGFPLNEESWKGLKINEISMRWLDTIANETTTSFPSLSGQSIVIDHNGFSGIVEVTGLLPMDVGKMDGWAFSVDLLGVQVLQNQASGFEFAGAVVVPILEKDEETDSDTIYTAISYGASFDFVERKYAMSVGLESPATFDMKVFKGEATIQPDSRLDFEYREDDGYGVEAILNGSYTMKEIAIFGKKMSIPSVTFQNLAISSQKKYIRNVGTWGLSLANGKFMGIRYNASAMTIDTINGDPLIRIAANINFAQKDGIQISAATAFTVEGYIEDNPDSQKYKWETVNINLIEIEADLESVYFFGQIILFKEFPVWGTGFQGKVELYVTGANETEGSAQANANLGFGAMALFGTTENEDGEEYRYFLIDMMARLGDGIPITSTGTKLLGAGGGVYYHMDQLSISQNIQDVAYNPGDPNNTDAFTQYIIDRIGVSLSGAQYLPNDKKLFGVNMNVVLSIEGKPEVFNANIGFTIQINSSFGIDFIRLKGITNFMSSIAWTGPSVEGLSAVTELNLVFPGEDNYVPPGFYGESHFFLRVGAVLNNKQINVLVGDLKFEDVPPVFQTIFNNAGVDKSLVKYAGSIETELTEENWFINVGTPDKRLKLKVDLALLKVGLDAYFDIGTNIPPAPPLPPDIASQLNWTPIPEPSRATGNGFAFGGKLDYTVGGDYTIFTAILELQIGFDLMMQQYEPVYCDENPLGVLFFYASGQAYTSIHGEVSGFGYVLFDVGAAGALSFKAPNPSYAKGAVSGYYNILFGTYQGNCYFPFEIGEQCSDSEDLDLQIDLIADLSPAENSTNIATDATLTGAVYFPLNEETTMNDQDGEPINYELQLLSFDLLQNGIEVPGQIDLNTYSLSFISDDLLKEETDYVLNFEVGLRNLSTNEIEFSESKSHFFTTGQHPDNITLSNVDATWPQDGQFNFYHETNNTGFIQLKRNQGYLFQSNNLYYAKITTSYPAAEVARPLTYNASNNKLSFTIPSNLPNAKAYRIQIVKGGPKNNTGALGGISEMDPVSNTLDSIEGDTLPPLRSDETLLFTYFFRKSVFDNPLEKYSSLTIPNMANNAIVLEDLQEPFGKEELIGLHGKPNSFNARMKLDDTEFYNYYENYETTDGIIQPYEGNSGRPDYDIAIKDRLSEIRIAKYGNQNPYRAIDISQNLINPFVISTENFDEINQLHQEGSIYGAEDIEVVLSYKLDQVAYGDIQHFIETSFNSPAYQELKTKVLEEEMPDECDNSPDFVCCEKSVTYRNDIAYHFKSFHTGQNDIFNGVYRFINDKNSCSNLWPTTINDYDLGFLRTNLPLYELENGTYPIYFRYINPITEEKIYSPTINLINTSGSE